MLEKPCIAEGCKEEGCFGYAPARSGPVFWACPLHRELLQDVKRRSSEERRTSPANAPLPGPRQGRLL